MKTVADLADRIRSTNQWKILEVNHPDKSLDDFPFSEFRDDNQIYTRAACEEASVAIRAQLTDPEANILEFFEWASADTFNRRLHE